MLNTRLEEIIEESIKFYRKNSTKMKKDEKDKEVSLKNVITSDRKYLLSYGVSGFRVLDPAVMSILHGDEHQRANMFLNGFKTGKLLVREGLVTSLESLQRFLFENQIMILDIYKILDKEIELRVYESLRVSGLPNIGKPICHYETGLFKGVLQEILDKKVKVRETKCKAQGYPYCQFKVVTKYYDKL